MTEDAARRKVVVLYLSRPDDSLRTHEGITLVAVADAIARLKHYRFGGRWDESHRQSGRIFFVPDETLLAPEARQLGIGSADDLFGGVVPYSFVRTKAITHFLVGGNAERPEGWSDVFAGRIRDVVLPGYTAFSVRDAAAHDGQRRSLGLRRLGSGVRAGRLERARSPPTASRHPAWRCSGEGL